MEGQYWLIKSSREIDRVISHLKQWCEEWDYSTPLTIQPKPYKNPRSLTQNALMHKWFNDMAAHFSKKVETSAEQMKALMKLKFLGTEDIVINHTVIPGQLKHTSKLDKGEMMRFMDDIYDWALDHGVKLTIPEDSEYMKLRKQHG